LEILYALKVNWISRYGLGKVGIAVSWPKGIKLLSLKKSSTVCVTIPYSIFSSSSTNFFFFKNTGKRLCSAQWLVLNAKGKGKAREGGLCY
jgi:hypothetical protein